MKTSRIIVALLLVGLLAGTLAAQAKPQPKAQPKARPARRAYIPLGGPFNRLKGLPVETRQKLGALWADAKKKTDQANAASMQVLKTYHEQGERILNNTQRKELTTLRAARRRRSATGT